MRIHIDLFNHIWYKVVNPLNKCSATANPEKYQLQSVTAYYEGSDRYLVADNLIVYCTHEGRLQLHFDKGDISDLSDVFNQLI